MTENKAYLNFLHEHYFMTLTIKHFQIQIHSIVMQKKKEKNY